MTSIAILGSGPAGLMAALAADRNGHHVNIYSSGKAVVNPDMFLMAALPGYGADVPHSRVIYIKWGLESVYAVKAYCDPDIQTSWSSAVSCDIWWLDPIYQMLWERFRTRVIDRVVDPWFASALLRHHDLVINTLPADKMCMHPERHTFDYRSTWLVRREVGSHEGNHLIYNGEAETDWYRYSHLRGYATWEYGVQPVVRSKDSPVLRGKKIVGSNCDCLPRVQRVGRWARWERGVLNHHVYEQTLGILASAGLGKGA